MSKPNRKKIVKAKSKKQHHLFKKRAQELKAKRPLPAKAKAHLGEKETKDQASSKSTSCEQVLETGPSNSANSVATNINLVAKRKRKNGEDMSKLVFLKLGKPLSHMIDENEVATRVRNWSVEHKSTMWAENHKTNAVNK